MIDGTGAEPVEQCAVLIRDGLIVYAGARDKIPETKDTHVIEAPDLTLMPGFIDGHNSILSRGIHGAIKALRHYVQHGITTAITFQGNPANELLGAPLRDAIEQGMLRGCCRLVVGYAVNCTNGHNNGRIADGPWEVRKAVREMVQAGADFIKTASTGGFWGRGEGVHTPNYTKEELCALVDEAHSWGLVVGVHAHAQPGINMAIEAGADIIYHAVLLDQKGIEQMVARKTWFVPTLRVTCTRNITAWPHRPWIQAKLEATAIPHREGVRAALAAGVNIAAGCDGPGSPFGWRSGEGPIHELGELAACGMSNLEVIKAATLGTATAYRINDRVGSLEPGKEADIVAVYGNPEDDLKEIRDQRNIGLVLQKGRVEYADARHREHYDICDPVEPLGKI